MTDEETPADDAGKSSTSTSRGASRASGSQRRLLRKPKREPVEQTKAPEVAAAPPVKTRRRPLMAGLGVALIALGGLGGAALVNQGAASRDVVVLKRNLTAGERVDKADLGTISITGGDGASTIPEDRLTAQVGRWATSDVPAGTVLAPGMTSSDLAPQPGQTIIGIPVKPGQLPATGLRSQQKVRLVLSAGTSAGTTPPKGLTFGQSWKAIVINASGRPADDQSITVDVSVPTSSATDVALAVGTRQLVIVLDPQERS